MGEPEKVLVVDDEPQVLVALEDVLGDDFSVLKAESADKALKILGTEPDIAVLLTDQRMPNMTGDQLLASLRNWCKARRILITGFADLNAVVRAVNDGELFAYVTKPWDPEDLMLKVTGAASHFRLAEKLEYEQRLLYDLMDNSPDGIYFKDAERRFQRANRPYSDALGLDSAEQLLGKTIREVLNDSELSLHWSETDESVFTSRRSKRDVIRSYPNPNAPAWISETIAPVCGPAGDTLGLVGITRDVTERVRVEEALRNSEQRFREQSELLNSILDSMDDGVVVADASGKLVYFNRRAEALLGAAGAGHSVREWSREYGFSSPDGSTPLEVEKEPLFLAVQGKSGAEVEVCIRGKRSEPLLVALKASPLASAGEPSRGGVALLRDVTNQRLLEQQVLQSQKMEAVGRLAGGVAHDFSNLLAVIESYGELVLGALAEGDAVREDVQEILAASRRASNLTRQLLEFSRQRSVQPQSVSLNTVVAGIERMLQRLVGDRAELSFTLAPEAAVVRVDPGQLEQVVMNLVINARDAVSARGKISVSTRNAAADEVVSAGAASADYVVLTVTDDGIGMDRATLTRIFEPFFTTKGVERGTGLGLSTVYGIVTQNNGHIQVDSEPGKGTTFKVYLPRDPEPVIAPGPSSSSFSSTTSAGTILLVEKDETLRAATARVLRARGLQVLEAASAEQAESLAADVPIDVLLVDLSNSEVGDRRLRDLLAAANERVRVLYLSSSTSDPRTARHMEQGDGLLERPFAPSELADQVVRLLD